MIRQSFFRFCCGCHSKNEVTNVPSTFYIMFCIVTADVLKLPPESTNQKCLHMSPASWIHQSGASPVSPSAVLNQSGRILVLSLSSLDHSTRADSIMGDWGWMFFSNNFRHYYWNVGYTYVQIEKNYSLFDLNGDTLADHETLIKILQHRIHWQIMKPWSRSCITFVKSLLMFQKTII